MKAAAAFSIGACLATGLILAGLVGTFPRLMVPAVSAALLTIPALCWYILEVQLEQHKENKNART